MLSIFVFVIFGLVAVVDLLLMFKTVEYIYCAFLRSQPPFVPSNKNMRQMVAREISRHYPHCKSVCEIGAGYGGLARCIARCCGVRVVALENMPFTAFVSRIADMFCRADVRTHWCNALGYLGTTKEKFDVAVAYMGPKITPELVKFRGRFSVLISLDFEIPGRRPVRIIDCGPGKTIYDGRVYPHRIFVYEF